MKSLLSRLRNRSGKSTRRAEPNSISDQACIPPEDLASTIRFFANPGPQFEERQTPDTPAGNTRAKAIAFYLPQFHTFPENDRWWGHGFTEWRNVARGTPRYEGHYQPRIPRDLGFYDLTDRQVITRQAALARAAGIDGFCFYYYWFNGKRLMQKPLDLFAESDIDQSFCLMWANENWTRRWDGRDEDVLIAQSYRQSDESSFLQDTARYMEHPRYIRFDERPLFLLYRPSLLPEPAETIQRWRHGWKKLLGITPYVYMAQTYQEFDPRPFGCDGAVEFPPHKVSRGVKRQNAHFKVFDPDFSGQIRSYEDVMRKSLREEAPDHPLIKTVCPHWDNDARREGKGVSFQGSTPERYAQWLEGAIRFAREHPAFTAQPLVFINAWNEWAEAAYLEPDIHYGHAYLNATWKTLSAQEAKAPSKETLLLVGHDAHANGAQMLLLSIARYLKSLPGVHIRILLSKGGALLPHYQAIAHTIVLDTLPKDAQQTIFSDCGCQQAIFNTSVTGHLLQQAQEAHLHCVALVHEMPALIREYALQSHLHAIAKLADVVVFPSDAVRDGFASFESYIRGQVHIQPQGLYKELERRPGARHAICRQLRIPDDSQLIINAGYADHRKGFDLFVEAASRLIVKYPEMHFCWLGKRCRSMSRWLKSTFKNRLSGRLHLVDFTDDMDLWYSAADALYLSSREDPFPSVVLEALSLGLPVIIHQGATGFDSSILSLVSEVTIDDADGIESCLRAAIETDTPQLRQRREQHVKQHHSLSHYGDILLALSRNTATL